MIRIGRSVPPHPGEFTVLFDKPVESVSFQPENHRMIVVLNDAAATIRVTAHQRREPTP